VLEMSLNDVQFNSVTIRRALRPAVTTTISVVYGYRFPSLTK